jgi:hypothetical protein
MDRLQTMEQAARSLQFAPSTLRHWMRQGRISGHSLNPAPWADLLDFTSAQPTVYFRPREVLADVSR